MALNHLMFDVAVFKIDLIFKIVCMIQGNYFENLRQAKCSMRMLDEDIKIHVKEQIMDIFLLLCHHENHIGCWVSYNIKLPWIKARKGVKLFS